MRTITVSEKMFDDLFERFENEFAYDHKFMGPHETQGEFEKTVTHKLLLQVRGSVRQLKNDLIRLP